MPESSVTKCWTPIQAVGSEAAEKMDGVGPGDPGAPRRLTSGAPVSENTLL